MAVRNRYETATGAGAKNGTNWANAFDEPAYEAYVEGGGLAAHDVIWQEDGIYTMDSSVVSTVNGTAIAPIAIIGVKAGTTNEPPIFSDWSRDAADRPFIDCATFTYQLLSYISIRNVKIQGADTYALRCGTYAIVENCLIHNDAGVQANKYALYVQSYSTVINNEIMSDFCNGAAISSGTCFMQNYVHDITNAVRGMGIVPDDCNTIGFNIFDNNRIHISSISKDKNKLFNNTYYGGDIGVNNTDGYGWVIANNIFSDCATAPMSWGTQTDNNFIWSNHIHNCGANVNIDETTCFKDYELTTGDPKFVTAGDDFTLEDDSPCMDTAMAMILGVGA